jgi:NAD(P)-dependent dehydrogenase (short-subunit alcohol dehydrogenase family)
MSAVTLTRLLLPGMIAGGFGRVIHIASTAALKGYAYVVPYVAAKHALLGFARALALEVAAKGVTVNAVCPGFTDTPLLEASVARIEATTGRGAAEARAALTQGNPQGRLFTPAEVADAVLYLCHAPGVNGAALTLSGGEV